jgi:hypothetical protein
MTISNLKICLSSFRKKSNFPNPFNGPKLGRCAKSGCDFNANFEGKMDSSADGLSLS